MEHIFLKFNDFAWIVEKTQCNIKTIRYASNAHKTLGAKIRQKLDNIPKNAAVFQTLV